MPEIKVVAPMEYSVVIHNVFTRHCQFSSTEANLTFFTRTTYLTTMDIKKKRWLQLTISVTTESESVAVRDVPKHSIRK